MYSIRDNAIKDCIAKVSDNVKDLREKRDKDPDNFEVIKQLRKEQTSVSLKASFYNYWLGA